MTAAAMRAEIDKYEITLETRAGPTRTHDDDGWEHYAYELRLSYMDQAGDTHTLDTPWRAGMGHESGDVDLADVLYSLVSDSYFAGYDFEDFASELGYDTDSRKAFAQWEAVQDECRRFKDWCASDDMLDALAEAAQDY
jgi:hypothetical protein